MQRCKTVLYATALVERNRGESRDALRNDLRDLRAVRADHDKM